jgi:hypothetical protein
MKNPRKPYQAGVTQEQIDSANKKVTDTIIEEIRFRPEPAKPVGMVIMQPEPFKTSFPISVYPNRWRRFWYWALLGWRFERNDKT